MRRLSFLHLHRAIVERDPSPKVADPAPYPSLNPTRVFVHAFSILERAESFIEFWNLSRSSSISLGKVTR